MMTQQLPEPARVINALFKDVGLYVDEEGNLYTREGRKVGKSDAFLEFPQEFETLSSQVNDALRKHRIVRILTLDKVIQLSPTGEYRVYDRSKVKVLEGFAALKKATEIRRGLYTTVMNLSKKDKREK